jgi:hypothetical protein
VGDAPPRWGPYTVGFGVSTREEEEEEEEEDEDEDEERGLGRCEMACMPLLESLQRESGVPPALPPTQSLPEPVPSGARKSPPMVHVLAILAFHTPPPTASFCISDIFLRNSSNPPF